ncbi:MAG: NAD+ synthase [Gammaproteobacteria bacterium]
MSGKLSIVMAQLNLLVGDIEGNTERVIQCAREGIAKHAADIIVFPELTLTSYPPEDLLLRPSLQLRIEKALQRILVADLPITCVVGYPDSTNGKLYNALGVLRGRKVLATYHKQSLPNYQVFDERRYFESGSEPCVLDIEGIKVAFTVCEDIWESGPVTQVKEAGAELLININASPFHIGKLELRKNVLRERSSQGEVPILYVNLVGGQDELIFDGGSMIAMPEGDCKLVAPLFEEGLYPVELSADKDGHYQLDAPEHSPQDSVEAHVYQALVLGVKDYVNKNNFKGVVLGLSGGIDSALTLAIAVDALGKERVEAVMMPFEYTSQLSLDCAQVQAQSLGVEYKVIAINSVYESFMEALKDEFAGKAEDVSEQNLQARARGVILMAISNKKGLLVLTTGNKSEIAVGYSTLYGDMAGGFNALKDVSKTLVYRLARYRNSLENGDAEIIPVDVIDRPPSAELAPGQLDQDSLPDYDTLDKILELYVEQDLSAAAIVKQGFSEQDVNRVLRLVDLNEYKRRQAPVGVRLTQRGFGRDRRYPITNAWRMGE